MPRKKRIFQSELPYHVNGRCINRDWFALPMDRVWEIMSDELFFIHHAFQVRIHSFVLMSNHFHLLISTPNSNLDKAMQHFMYKTSRSLTSESGRINQCWGARHFPCLIDSHHYYLAAYKYVYQNPVVAGICSKVEDYKYSTLYGLLGFQPMIIPLEEDLTLFSNVEVTMKWLNEPVERDDWRAVGYALSRRKFKFSKSTSANKPHHLEFDLL